MYVQKGSCRGDDTDLAHLAGQLPWRSKQLGRPAE